MNNLSQSLLAPVVSRLVRQHVHKVLVKACIYLDTKQQNMPVTISGVSAIFILLLIGSKKQRKFTHGRSWSMVIYSTNLTISPN
jgi:hypothetical protein